MSLIDSCVWQTRSEIDEIWLTFPDPQIKFQRQKTPFDQSSLFSSLYNNVSHVADGVVHLKTDSEFTSRISLLGVYSRPHVY